VEGVTGHATLCIEVIVLSWEISALFILKRGRIRIFRLSPDCRALTTAIINPGTVFGEMVVVGQQMHDSFAEALDEVIVCVVIKADVRRLLLGDPRIAARISETLGRRLDELEQRLSDAIFKSVPERLAAALTVMSAGRAPRPLARGVQINLTHEQLAGLAGASRETTTKILGEFADQGLIGLGRGRITLLQPTCSRMSPAGKPATARPVPVLLVIDRPLIHPAEHHARGEAVDGDAQRRSSRNIVNPKTKRQDGKGELG
jgi:CRP-like cAMP-binding protein